MSFHRRILTLVLALGTGLAAHAERLLNEPFDYTDGALTSVAPDLWKLHSGTASQLDVTGGVLNVTGSESEDANRSFTGTGLTSGTLFASFDVTLTALPSTSGGYFFHFKDTVDSGANTAFIGRVFAQTANAATDKFRVAVSFGAGTAVPVQVEKDLDLNTAYRLVIRLNFASTNATLWVNPATESATSDRAVSTDTRGVGLGMSQVAFRQASGIGTLKVDNLLVGTRFADVAEGGDATQNPPVVASIPDQKSAAGAPVGPLSFTVADGETDVAQLTLSGASSDTTLLPDNAITFGGSGADRTVSLQPAAGRQGRTTVTVTARDSDGNTASRAFTLIVGEPSISGLRDLIADAGTAFSLPFTVSDAEGDPLQVSVTSSNPDVLAFVAVEGNGTTRTIRGNPDVGISGLSRITVVVSDGANSITNGFNVTVAKKLGVILEEPFTYPDETALSLTGIWLPHSGTNDGPVIVRGGKALLMTTSTNREDVNITYNSPTVRIADGVVLFARLDVTFTSVPTGANGGYFAHFLGTAGGSFRGRLFAGRRGLTGDQFQIGLANNAANASAWHPAVVSVGQPLTLLVRYNVSTGASTLWVNPLNEGSPSVDGSDSPFPSDMVAFALRQDSGFGALEIDLLKIGTAYSDVLTPVVIQDYSLQAGLEPNGSARFTFPAAALPSGFVLEASDSPVGGWQPAPAPTVTGDTAALVVSPAAARQFYRLRRP